MRAVVASVVGGPGLAEAMRAALAKLPDEAFELPDEPDEAAVRALAEAWVLADKLCRVASAARPELATRCSGAATALTAALT